MSENGQAEKCTVCADETKKLHDEAATLFDRQFKQLVWGGVILLAMVIVGIWLATRSLRQPGHQELLVRLEASTKAVNDLASPLAGVLDAANGAGAFKVGNATLVQEVRKALSEQAAQNTETIRILRAADSKPSPETLTLMQLLGGTAVVAVLGYLGLMRLQNLDQELHNMRNFMFEQINSRTTGLRAQLRADIAKDVMKATKDDIETVKKQVDDSEGRIKEQVYSATSAFEDRVKDSIQMVMEADHSLKETLGKYPWLVDDDKRTALAALDQLQSVEKAHELASEMFSKGDALTATAVLRAIVEKKLPGDKDDFHNAHSEAMQQDDPALGLAIVELGLESFPGNYDLMADKAKALEATGRAGKAKTMLEEWRRSKPQEFARSWRPAVFYADVVEAGEMTDADAQELEATLRDVSTRSPLEDKVWSSYARFLVKRARTDDAIVVLNKGIMSNPFSQVLHFSLGELLLRTGRADEAVLVLQKAVQFDYQDQFQADVTADAVLGMLAQAYEAAGQAEDAIRIYQDLLTEGASGAIQKYAKSRLRMFSALTGQDLEGDEDGEADVTKRLIFSLAMDEEKLQSFLELVKKVRQGIKGRGDGEDDA